MTVGPALVAAAAIKVGILSISSATTRSLLGGSTCGRAFLKSRAELEKHHREDMLWETKQLESR